MKADKVVVTNGYTGAFGSVTVRRFLEHGFSVVDREPDRQTAELAAKGYRAYEVDLLDEQKLGEGLAE